jgi:Ser/Thr protein kinase RdoA (MazF antagonist)
VLPWLEPADQHRAKGLASAARAGLAAASPSHGLCHGDATLDNVVVVGGTEEDPALVLFDFDLAGYGYLASDFPFQAKNFEHFLAGYREIRPIAAADLAAEASMAWP